ncbi:MAG: Imm40 family immunity protein [Acidobacteriota bacterium]|nr:Imm40 family immunity protein [Acidobacteriota bacterium]
MMEETQFSLEVWKLLSEKLRESAIAMSDKEVAWNRADTLSVIETFQKFDIALVGIEFFYFNKESKYIFATMEIFSADIQTSETWQDFVIRSCINAKLFVTELEFDQKELKRGKPIFNIWAFNEEEYSNPEL